MSSTFDVSPANQSPNKNMERNSCSTSFSDDSNETEDRISTLEFDFQNSNCSRNTRFQPEIIQPEITVKLHKKAVHVLFSLCWDKDIDQETLWTALMIFYSFKARRVIKKINLQKMVSVCVLLSCKLFNEEKLSSKDVIQITNGKYTLQQIFQAQEEILSVLDFDLYIENSISKAKSVYGLDEMELQEFNCLAEMLMLKGSEVFWKRSVLDCLLRIIRGVVVENENETKGELMQVWRSKEGELILRKYSSRLNVQKLMQRLGKQ